MFQSAFRYFIFLIILLHVQPAAAQPGPADNKPWLKDYQEHRQYGNVFVVKKITVKCEKYETWLVDQQGKKLTPAFKDIGDFADGLAEFVAMEGDPNAGQHGFIDMSGKVIVPPVYVSTDRFRNGKTWVIYRAGKQFGLSYIDTKGNTIYKMPIQYFKNDFLISKAEVRHLCGKDTREDVLWGKGRDFYILNFNFSPFIEKEIKSSKYIYHFSYQGKFGIIDKNMILKVPVALDDIDPTYEFSGQGMERVKYGDKFGYLNVFTGDMVTPFEYTDTRKPTNGLFWVKKNNRWGCIDKSGKTRIAFLYDEATGFTKEDRSAVAINGKFGHIDKSGKIRTPLKYDFASYYNNGRSMVRIDDKYGYIDTTGKFIVEPIYDEALPFDKPTTTVERTWLRYKLDLKGNEEFNGFSYKLNAVFILIGLLIFIRINSFFFDRFRKARAAKAAKKGTRV
ncbi:WG repeat-containing protein [Dyadobacter luticola]|uniref:WG repeat-containing protein n=1 Tax=Dyadobacter luticola TaxID=1979387 RepID=A0A5R9L653_9BACT|nr:WG repeat-containing protein [Dyadobacter luticola]TLV04062.1 WG repeat-containing protein [Dyadobacter luticola]